MEPNERETVRELLDLYAAGELDPERTRLVNRVLAEDEALRAELAQAKLIQDALREAVTDRAPKNLAPRVLAQVRVEGRPKIFLPPVRNSWLPWVLGGAGVCLALTLGVFLLFPQLVQGLGLAAPGLVLPDWTGLACGIGALLFAALMVLRTAVNQRRDNALRRQRTGA